MTEKEYNKTRQQLIATYKKRQAELGAELTDAIKSLDNEFGEGNAKFKVGDFVRNITGIYKIINVTAFSPWRGEVSVGYDCVKYKKHQGELVRTKDPNVHFVYEDSVKLLTWGEYD